MDFRKEKKPPNKIRTAFFGRHLCYWQAYQVM